MAVFTNYIRIVVAMSVIAFVSGVAQGMVIDGQLGDWGVTPFADWTPTTGTAYVVDNWGDSAGQHGAYPNGGEVFDLEAGYSRYDAGMLYVAIVTSLPASGARDPYGRSNWIMPGDIAISLNGVSGYKYGIIGYGSEIGTVVRDPSWSLPDGSIGVPANGPSTLSGGTKVGKGSAVYVDAGALETGNSHTYVIEMAIPVSLMDASGLLTSATFHYTPTCGNDVLNWSTELPNVPEPSVIALMAMGVVGLPLRRRMK